MTLPGILHTYDTNDRLVCFESPGGQGPTSTHCVLFIGGLGDGLQAIPALTPLTHALHSYNNWCLVQVLLRDSYSSWGTGSVQREADDVGKCVQWLHRTRGMKTIVLMGHSTGTHTPLSVSVFEHRTNRCSSGTNPARKGCQDVLQLFKTHPSMHGLVQGVILQAPVSSVSLFFFSPACSLSDVAILFH